MATKAYPYTLAEAREFIAACIRHHGPNCAKHGGLAYRSVPDGNGKVFSVTFVASPRRANAYKLFPHAS